MFHPGVLISGQINASLISVVPERKSGRLVQYEKAEIKNQPVGSDDILESVHLLNDGQQDLVEDEKDEEYGTMDPDYDLIDNVREVLPNVRSFIILGVFS